MDTVHMLGMDELESNDIFAYFAIHPPTRVDWIDSSSCMYNWEMFFDNEEFYFVLRTYVKLTHWSPPFDINRFHFLVWRCGITIFDSSYGILVHKQLKTEHWYSWWISQIKSSLEYYCRWVVYIWLFCNVIILCILAQIVNSVPYLTHYFVDSVIVFVFKGNVTWSESMSAARAVLCMSDDPSTALPGNTQNAQTSAKNRKSSVIDILL